MFEKFKMAFSSARPRRISGRTVDEQVAVCAILLEVAEADSNFAPEEREEILNGLGKHFELSRPNVEKLVAEAEAERAASADLWPFTHSISRSYTKEQKLDVLTLVWQVILADGVLDPYEEQLARRLQSMLSVNQSLMQEGKRLARENMARR